MVHRRTKPVDARRTYGVLVGKVKDGREKPGGASPHYEIWIDAGGDFRVAVNVRSVDGSNVFAFFAPKFDLPTKLDLAALADGPMGFNALSTGPNGGGLDYLRDDLFPLEEMRQISPDGGPGITLSNLLDGQIERAKADQQAVAIVFGEAFHDRGSDETFGFSPEQGLHDIHMMQGNSGSFASDNRINGDGALFIKFAEETIALFVRFSEQATTTDDRGAPA